MSNTVKEIKGLKVVPEVENCKGCHFDLDGCKHPELMNVDIRCASDHIIFKKIRNGYYDKQLKIIADDKSEYPLAVKFFSNTKETKYLTLGIESIEAIESLLESVKSELTK